MNNKDKTLKRQLEISKLNRILSIFILYPVKDKYALQYSWFEWCIKGLMYEEMFEDQFKLAGKELLKHFNIPQVNTYKEINSYFMEIYDVYNPIRNNIETMDSIEEVRQYINNI